MYGTGPYLIPGSLTSPFDDVKVIAQGYEIEVFIRDKDRDLQELQVIEASITDKKGTRNVALKPVFLKPHEASFSYASMPTPPFQVPFKLHMVMTLKSEQLTIEGSYSGRLQGSFVSWKELE